MVEEVLKICTMLQIVKRVKCGVEVRECAGVGVVLIRGLKEGSDLDRRHVLRTTQVLIHARLM